MNHRHVNTRSLTTLIAMALAGAGLLAATAEYTEHRTRVETEPGHAQFQVTFGQVHPDAVLAIALMRTIRVPDDGRTYPLPPGLGTFPAVRAQSDHGHAWKVPMLQSEAMWVRLKSRRGYPFRVRVLAGDVDAVSGGQVELTPGQPPENVFPTEPQGFMVVPEQPWLDGFRTREGTVRQLVSEPLGAGRTAEEQLDPDAVPTGGMWIGMQPVRAQVWERELASRRTGRDTVQTDSMEATVLSSRGAGRGSDMGLAPGGEIVQQIIASERDEDDWSDQTAWLRIELRSSLRWLEETGHVPPQRPMSAREYTDAGFTWFTWWDEEAKALAGPNPLSDLKSIRDWAGKDPGVRIAPEQVRDLSPKVTPSAIGE